MGTGRSSCSHLYPGLLKLLGCIRKADRAYVICSEAEVHQGSDVLLTPVLSAKYSNYKILPFRLLMVHRER